MIGVEIPTHDSKGVAYTLGERRALSVLADNFIHDVVPCRECNLEPSSFTPATQDRVRALFRELLGPVASRFGTAYSDADKSWVLSFDKGRKSLLMFHTHEECGQCWTALQLQYIRRWMRGMEL